MTSDRRRYVRRLASVATVTFAACIAISAWEQTPAVSPSQTPAANAQQPSADAQQPSANPQQAATTAAPSPAVSAPPLTGEAATIKKIMEQKFPGVQIGSVSKSPYFGLYEVMFDERLVYTDPKVSYVVVGSIYDVESKKNLTEARMRQLSRVAFDSLPLDLAFKRVKGNGKRKLAIFSDADCPFCARLEKELKDVDNVTIYTFLFPIDQLHPDSARKSRIIWCSPDKVKAWDDFFASGKLPANSGDCQNPVAATNTLGQKLKVNATPTLIFADGSIVPGALPAQRLEMEMNQADEELAKVAAASGTAAPAKK